jgi:uncharacterized DUF497 family protein
MATSPHYGSGLVLFWDPPKRLRNLKRHGLDFAEAQKFDWTTADVSETHAGSRGERRLKAIGFLGDRLIALIFAPLGTEGLSVISMRAASRKERNDYGQRL